MLLTLAGLFLVLVLISILFVNFYPSFGGKVSKERQQEYLSSPNFKNGVFANKKNVPENLSFFETLKIARKFFFTKVPNGVPDKNIDVMKIDSALLTKGISKIRLIWFGHSAFLLQMEGKNILIDPMFGKVPAPHPWLGGNRFNKTTPIEVESLPFIDAVLLSHDHYDHLDYQSVQRLKGKVGTFYMPLGVGVHLEAWGIQKDQIKELDWWDQERLGPLTFICTPAQHFSGRRLNDRQSTLWGSWVIRSETEKIFFSGDSGYADHFQQIGAAYGPFDLAMLECGQYNESWSDIHMFPEETAQAGVDLEAKMIMPIHWGAFKLSLHSWTDPIERVTNKARELNIPIITPEIGELIEVGSPSNNNNAWWQQYETE